MRKFAIILTALLMMFPLFAGCNPGGGGGGDNGGGGGGGGGEETVAAPKKPGIPGELGVAVSEPADVIDVVDFHANANNNGDGILSARLLQGLVNKTLPRVYIERVDEGRNDVKTETVKLNVLKNYGKRTLNRLTNDNDSAHRGFQTFWTLFYKYHEEVNRLWVYEEMTYEDLAVDHINVAVMLAGKDNSIAVSKTLAKQIRDAGFKFQEVDVMDYCGFTRASNTLNIYDWAYDNLIDSCNPNMVFLLNPITRYFYGSYDYLPTMYDMVVALDAFVYYADSRTNRGKELERKILDHYDDMIPVIGCPGNWENQYVASIAAAGKMHYANDWDYMNGSLWMAFPDYTRQDAGAPIPDEFQTYNDEVYIAFTVSDGDAWFATARDNLAFFNYPALRSSDIPVGWTMPAAWRTYNPLLLEYYYEGGRAGGLDELMQGPSGVGYGYPSRMPEDSYKLFCELTRDHLGAVGFNMINYWDLVVDGTNSMIGTDEKYLAQMIDAVKPDVVFRGQASRTGNYKIINGTVCVEEVGDFRNSGCKTKNDLVNGAAKVIASQRATRPGAPVFIMLNVCIWGDGPEIITGAVTDMKKDTGTKYRFVKPSQLVAGILDYEAGNSLPTR